MRLILCTVALLTCASAQEFRDPSPHRTLFVTVADGVQLEVLDWGGTGRPLVFLAGYLTAHAYDDIAPKLTGVAHVYGITRRGLGASSKPNSGYTARESAEDIIHVLDALKLEKPVLAGHSFGGQDLSTLGAAYPDRMAGLIYLDSSEDTTLGPVTQAGRWPEPIELPEAMPNESQHDLSSFDAYRNWQRISLGMAFPEAELRYSYTANPDGTMGKYLVSKQVRDAMFAGLQPPDYARIRVPVLALFALPAPLKDQIERYKPRGVEEAAAMGLKYGLDLAWAARNEDALKRAIPGVQIVEIPNARTYIFLTNETDVLRETRAFLDKLDK